MSFVVELSPTARVDLERLFDFLLDHAQTTEDLDRAQAAIDTIRAVMGQQPAITPFSLRKAAHSPSQRELIVPFGGTGYVARHEIVSPSKVVVLAVRHQREEDFTADTNVAGVRERGELIAFGIMEYLDEDAYLVLFAVRPARQRQGIAADVLRWPEASAAAAGSSRVRVDARRDKPAARSFYNELGYHEVRIRPRAYGDRIDQVRLEKWLRAAPSGGA